MIFGRRLGQGVVHRKLFIENFRPQTAASDGSARPSPTLTSRQAQALREPFQTSNAVAYQALCEAMAGSPRAALRCDMKRGGHSHGAKAVAAAQAARPAWSIVVLKVRAIASVNQHCNGRGP